MDHQVDALIVGAVEQVRDRFGLYGLRDLVALAQEEVAKAEEAMKELSDDAEPRT